jgi:hypothetical protein
MGCWWVGWVVCHSGIVPDRPGIVPDRPGTAPDRPGIVPNRTGIVPNRTGIVPDRTGTVPDRTGIVPDRTGTVPDRTGIVPDRTGIVPDRVDIIANLVVSLIKTNLQRKIMPIHQSIDEFFTEAQVAIANAQANAEIQESLAAFGYTSEVIQEGKALYDRARTAQQQKQAEYGDQIAATDALNKAWERAKTTYTPLTQVARVAFKNDAGTIAQLALNGRRKKSLSGWLEQANLFYNNALANPDILNGLAKFGITAEKLQAGKAEVEALEGLNAAQEQEKGEAQQATKTRDEAIDVLDDWLDDFLAIAEVALADKPQLLEALGVRVRS